MRIPQSIALLCLVLGGASATGTPPIRTQLYSSFAAPPLGLELAEGVAAHNHTSYFAFIEHLAQQQPEQTTPNGVYTHGLKWIEHTGLLTPVAQSLLRLEMATRVYAPAAEAQFQLYAANVVPELRAVRGEFDEECAVWAQYKDRQACTPAALQKILDSEAFYGTTYVEQAQVEPQVLALDHVYDADSGDASAKLVVLYADVRADGFLEFHEHLKGLADNGDIRYVLRYGPQAHGRSEKPLALSGYGVELALKSTEYKVTDDRDLGGNSGQRTRVTGQDVQGGGEALLFSAETEPVVRGLGETQLQRLGVQAAQMVISATDKLAVLRRLAQDLPRYAHLLAELPVNSTLADEIGSADALVGDAIVVNGVRLSDENLDPFHILDHLRRENTIIDSLQTAGLTQQQALGLLLNADAADDVDDEEGSDDDDSESEAMVFDMRDQSADQKTIWWLNDLESDKRYASWPSDTSRLLRVVTPGMMQPVRKNVVQTVFALDLSKAESWILVFEDMLGNIEHGMPMQFGVAPLIDYADAATQSAANQMARLLLYMRRVFKRRDWQTFMRSTLITHLRKQREAKTMFVDSVRDAYERHIATHRTRDDEQPLTWADVVSGGPEWLAARWQSTAEYCARLDLSPASAPASGLAFINGVQLSLADNYQQRLFREFQMQTWRVASSLRDGSLAEDADIQQHVYGSAVPARSAMVFESDESPLRFLDLGGAATQQWMDDDVHYLGKAADTTDDDVVSVWVIGDFAAQSVRHVAAKALAAAAKERAVRVALVHAAFERSAEVADRAAGEDDDADEDDDVDAPQVLFQLATAQHEHSESPDSVLAFVTELLTDPESAKAGASDRFAQLAEPAGDMADDADQTFERTRRVLNTLGALPAEPGSALVVANGRVLPPITTQTAVSPDTFVLLARHERQERIHSVRRALAAIGADDHDEDRANVLLKATAIVEHGKTLFGSAGVFTRTLPAARSSSLDAKLSTASSTYLAFNDVGRARFRVQCVVDPLSENAQKWVPLLQTLLTLPDVSLELWLSPQLKAEKELPVRRFYRYLWPADLEFDEEGAVTGPGIEFVGIPADPLLTLGMDVPPSWLVTATDSVHDLDNIRLSSVRTHDISATFRLMHILVEGHLVDSGTWRPARGLEVQLGTAADAAMTDTIVMANFGYLQLKAGPGVWRFSVREGRSADIYRIDHIGEGRWDYAAAARRAQAESDDRRPVLVTSFCGTTIFPLVSKRPGRESEDVLDGASTPRNAATSSPSSAAASGSGLWGKLKGTFAAQNNTSTPPPHFDVFAVASGHLYERLMSIMMLSVRNTTQSTVKFWLIENFLSPSFKRFVPHMAREFGFEYEFVTYKWPHWLHKETEKQRTIWGYKILFLDVLFPLGLDRVIFVDADQIVRTDLQELADMDLNGKPYGFTPFCDDRPEIDGYRFWKQGWWKDHLRGKPYHISALYVVDLRRFRQLAAGDRMRGQYQALSQDGGSLANLDQDLPNNMQHVVPIHSLPQEWLWCETWCGDQGLKTAKTIDLCNNPMTKEPKLERARRLLPEWNVFDQRVAEFSRKLMEQGSMEGAQIVDAEAVNIDAPAETTSSGAPVEPNVHDEL